MPEQRDEVTPGRAAKDAVPVLNRDQVHGVHVQEVGGSAIRLDVAFRDLEVDSARLGMPPAGIVHGEHEAVELGELHADRLTQIRRERGDSALTRRVVADHCDLVDRAALGSRRLDEIDGIPERRRVLPHGETAAGESSLDCR